MRKERGESLREDEGEGSVKRDRENEIFKKKQKGIKGDRSKRTRLE